MRNLIFSLITILSPLHAQSPAPLQYLQAIGSTQYHLLPSQVVGRDYHIFVRLPENLSQAADTLFPAVYLLDGGWTYPLLGSYYHYLHLAEEIPTAIMVGISYGNDDWRNGNYRSTDYTAPAAERDFWGGAAQFQQVLEREVIPLIEKNYPADPEQRILFGQSIGGQFVLYTAQTRPRLFRGHIASNPALHRNLDFFLRWQGESAMPLDATRLFVASAELDDQRFREPAWQWIDHWQSQAKRPFILQVKTLPGETHLSAVPAAFREGMSWLFSEP